MCNPYKNTKKWSSKLIQSWQIAKRASCLSPNSSGAVGLALGGAASVASSFFEQDPPEHHVALHVHRVDFVDFAPEFKFSGKLAINPNGKVIGALTNDQDEGWTRVEVEPRATLLLAPAAIEPGVTHEGVLTHRCACKKITLEKWEDDIFSLK